MRAKSSDVERFVHRLTEHDDTYYQLTLDPTVKDHRVIALVIDHTSKRGDCAFYRSRAGDEHCTIAPKFMVLRTDCAGICFIHGLTCPVILDYLEGIGESDYDSRGSRKKTAR